MILNLFIAVIFEGFEDSQKAEEREVVTLCVEEWRKRDPDLAMTLPLEDAMAFGSRKALLRGVREEARRLPDVKLQTGVFV